MTKVNEILVELRKGTSLTDIRKNKNFRSQTQITQATQLYLEESEQDVARTQKTLSSLNTQVKDLQSEINIKTEESSRLSKAISGSETKRDTLQEDIMGLVTERKTRQKELNYINAELTNLSEKGITQELVTRIHDVEVESGDALLKRVETASSHVGIQRGLAAS